jgi:hypothetical protein
MMFLDIKFFLELFEEGTLSEQQLSYAMFMMEASFVSWEGDTDRMVGLKIAGRSRTLRTKYLCQVFDGLIGRKISSPLWRRLCQESYHLVRGFNPDHAKIKCGITSFSTEELARINQKEGVQQ